MIRAANQSWEEFAKHSRHTHLGGGRRVVGPKRERKKKKVLTKRQVIVLVVQQKFQFKTYHKEFLGQKSVKVLNGDNVQVDGKSVKGTVLSFEDSIFSTWVEAKKQSEPGSALGRWHLEGRGQNQSQLRRVEGGEFKIDLETFWIASKLNQGVRPLAAACQRAERQAWTR